MQTLQDHLGVQACAVKFVDGRWQAYSYDAQANTRRRGELGAYWRMLQTQDGALVMIFESAHEIETFLAEDNPESVDLQEHVRMMRQWDTKTVLTVDEIDDLVSECAQGWTPALTPDPAASVLLGHIEFRDGASFRLPYLSDRSVMKYLATACAFCLKRPGVYAFRFRRFVAEYRLFLRVVRGELDACEPDGVDCRNPAGWMSSTGADRVVMSGGTVEFVRFSQILETIRRGVAHGESQVWLAPAIPKQSCECQTSQDRTLRSRCGVPIDIAAAGGAS